MFAGTGHLSRDSHHVVQNLGNDMFLARPRLQFVTVIMSFPEQCSPVAVITADTAIEAALTDPEQGRWRNGMMSSARCRAGDSSAHSDEPVGVGCTTGRSTSRAGNVTRTWPNSLAVRVMGCAELHAGQLVQITGLHTGQVGFTVQRTE